MKPDIENKILDAAFDVVAENTINGTRMHLIAKKAGMAQSNLHYHFKTKDAILVALLDYTQIIFDETRKKAMEACPDTLEGQLRGIYKQKIDIIKDRPEYDRIQMDFWSTGQVNKEINEAIDRSYDTWREDVKKTITRFKPEADPAKVNLVAHIFISTMIGASFQYLCNPSTFKLEPYSALCLEIITDYLEK